MDAVLTSAIAHALKDLQYGSVHLVVHDGRLVRIERVERIRLPSEEFGQAAFTGHPGDVQTPLG